jgi:hypothetical protein
MKAKQIEKLLTGVMTNFLESITDEEVKKIIKERSYITGGCIPSMLLDEFVNDFDIYFYYIEDVEKVKDYYQRQRLDISFIPGTHKFECKLITENSINLSDKVQLIIKFVGDPMIVTEKFDWQHIKSWYSCKAEKLHLTSDVYQLVVEKELVYTGSDYPLSSLMRLKKYIKKGWNVSNTTILHIALDIVASFNKMENERALSSAKKSFEVLNGCCAKIKSMSQEEFDELDRPIKDFEDEDEDEENDKEDFRVITNKEELALIDMEVERCKSPLFNVDDIIYHLNGVDPLTVQTKLLEKTEEYLTIENIIKTMKGE